MDCQTARDWLLQAERPTRLDDAPAELACHVEECPRCQRLAGKLEGLEQRYRDELRPVSAEHAPDQFLARLKAAPIERPVRRRLPLRRWAVAAMVLLTVGAVAWALLTPRAQAAPDVVERLIDWNLQLTQSQAPEGRTQIHAERATLEEAVEQADLPTEERELAVALLESGSWLAANADPTAEADRFNDLADSLLAQLDAATTKKDAKRLRRLAKFYRRIAERGIQANLDRAESTGALDFRRQGKLERVILRDAQRAEKLGKLLERAPNASRKEIRRALGVRKPPRHKKPRRD